MKLKTLVIDDEQNARDIMIYLLKKYCPTIDLVGTADGVASARKLIMQTKPDLIFLDIYMKDGSGFELLDSFDPNEFHVVFVTAYDVYGLKAFNYNAVDYLLKPVDKKALISTVARIDVLKKLRTGLKPIGTRILGHL